MIRFRGTPVRASITTCLAAAVVALTLTGPAGTDPAAAMTGGSPVLDGTTAPWVATLARRGTPPDRMLRDAWCGGALVAPDRVVTAAHCVAADDGAVDPGLVEVHVDARVLTTQPGEVRNVRAIEVLPGAEILPSPVDPASVERSSARDDLAVLLLDRPVTTIRPLGIATRRPAPGRAVLFFSHGWSGLTGPAARNDVLHRGDLTALSGPRCRAAAPDVTVDSTSVLCAQDRPDAPAPVENAVYGCWQDSGSPAVVVEHGLPYLVGVFSFGAETVAKDCGGPFPLYFADASRVRNWVLTVGGDHR